MGPVRQAGPLRMIKAPRELGEFKGGRFMKIIHCSFITDVNSQMSFSFGPAGGNVLLLWYDLCCWQIHQTHRAVQRTSGLKSL